MSRSPIWVAFFLIQTVIVVLFVVAFSRSASELVLRCQSGKLPREIISTSAEKPKAISESASVTAYANYGDHSRIENFLFGYQPRVEIEIESSSPGKVFCTLESLVR